MRKGPSTDFAILNPFYNLHCMGQEGLLKLLRHLGVLSDNYEELVHVEGHTLLVDLCSTHFWRLVKMLASRRDWTGLV